MLLTTKGAYKGSQGWQSNRLKEDPGFLEDTAKWSYPQTADFGVLVRFLMHIMHVIPV